MPRTELVPTARELSHMRLTHIFSVCHTTARGYSITDSASRAFLQGPNSKLPPTVMAADADDHITAE